MLGYKTAVESGKKLGRAGVRGRALGGAVGMEALESRWMLSTYQFGTFLNTPKAVEVSGSNLLLSTYQTSDYLAYAVGNSWGYVSTSGSVQNAAGGQNVAAGPTVNGVATAQINNTLVTTGGTVAQAQDGTQDATNGVRIYREDVTSSVTNVTGSTTVSRVFTNFLPLLPATLTDGVVVNASEAFSQTTTNTNVSGSTQATGTESVAVTVVGQESVTVPKGTFTALKITIHEVVHIDGTLPAADAVTDDTIWLVKSLGKVEAQHVDDAAAGNDYTLALNSSNIIDRNQGFVTHLYEDTLGREPDALGDQQYVTDLNDGAKTTTDVATAVLNSTEYRTDVIEGLYLSILGRHADSDGLTYWLNNFAKGGTVEQIKAGFYGSTEYFNAHGGTNDSVINAFYEAFLNRPVENGPTGLQFWEAKLAAGQTRAQIALSIESSSLEGATDIVTSAYETFLKRSPDQTGLDYWIPKVRAGTTQTLIIEGFIVAPEYYNRAVG